jgi:hypothetical protein
MVDIDTHETSPLFKLPPDGSTTLATVWPYVLGH